MKRLLGLALGLCLFASPAWAVFSLSFISNSSNSNNTGSSASISSTGNFTVAAGTPMIFFGDVVAMHGASDSVVFTDGGSNTWNTYQCPQTAGSLNVGVVSWTLNANGITAGKVTMTDNGGVTGAGGAMFMVGYTFTGFGTLSEDTLVRACTGQTASTTNPSLTTGAPAGSGEFVVTNYFSPTTNVGFTYTLDTGHGWAANGGSPSGSSRQTNTQDKQTNAGSSAVINNPTPTTNVGYSFQSMAFCNNGCAASTKHNATLLGVGP